MQPPPKCCPYRSTSLPGYTATPDRQHAVIAPYVAEQFLTIELTLSDDHEIRRHHTPESGEQCVVNDETKRAGPQRRGRDFAAWRRGLRPAISRSKDGENADEQVCGYAIGPDVPSRRLYLLQANGGLTFSPMATNSFTGCQ